MSKQHDENVPFYSIKDLKRWTTILWFMGFGAGVAFGAVLL